MGAKNVEGFCTGSPLFLSHSLLFLWLLVLFFFFLSFHVVLDICDS